MTSQPGPRTRAAAASLLFALLACAASCSSPTGLPGATGTTAAPLESDRGATRTLEGRLRAYVVDLAGGASRTGYALERAHGDFVDLEPAPELPGLLDALVTISGTDVGAGPEPAGHDAVRAGGLRVKVTSITAREAPGDPPADRAAAPVTTAHVAIVLLDFEGVAPQSLTVADVERSVANVHAYYQEISSGRWDFEADVFGPYPVPLPADCNLQTVDPLARGAAAAAGHPIPAGRPVGVALPGGTNLGCACGLAWVGSSPATPSTAQTVTGSDACLTDRSFNDVLTSMRVRPVAAPDAGAVSDGGLADAAGIADGGGGSAEAGALLPAIDGGGNGADGDPVSTGIGCGASGRAAGGSWPWLLCAAGAVLARRRRWARSARAPGG